jgi:nucleotide-binding universal stress UspA family protein
MRFGDILVILDATRDGRRRLDVALSLAVRARAKLIGYYVSPTEGLLTEGVPSDGGRYTGRISETQVPAGEVAEEFRDEFERQLKDRSLEGEWAISESRTELRGLLRYTRCTDLLVAGLPQLPPDFPELDIERLVVDSGRPVLGLPHANVSENLGRNIVIAWDGSREASRALHDAVPFLQQSASVRIIAIEIGQHPSASADEVVSHLQRLGISAAIDVDRGLHSESPADEILSRLETADADLLVAGAFGHSRFSERMFGGASRTFLHQMMIPVLVSH